MKKTTILAAIALMAGAVSAYAQEYLHVNSPIGTSTMYSMDDIDYIGVEEATEISERMKADEKISIFNAALEATGLGKMLGAGIDYSYDASKYSYYNYASNIWKEIAVLPPCKMKGYTLFVETDEVLKKHGVNNLKDLQTLAKQIYDKTYPADAGLYDDDFTNPKNPLYRFVAYHILTTDIRSLDRLTGRRLTYRRINDEEIGVHSDRMNPIEWYRTLLPNTLMKCERLTMKNWKSETCSLKNYYLNRRWDDTYQLRGGEVAQPESENSVVNGRYFYVDDIVAFTTDIRDKVQNMLIRMDLSTVFPELTTLDIRQNGNPDWDDYMDVADKTFKNGRNYWFPNGSIEGLKVNSGKMVYRRPHINFWSSQGDEFNVFGDYDVEISLPPVPFSGEWQVRLGFCALATRGVAQIFFDEVEQGEPIDLRLLLNDAKIMGTNFLSDDDGSYYMSLTDEEKAEDQKKLKAMGVYRGPRGGYHTNGDTKSEWVGKAQTYRRVLCQVYIDNTAEHILRIKNVGGSTNNELQLDYIELVPKSVYDVPEGQMESDL